MKTTPNLDASWTEAWKLYSDHQKVFFQVLANLRRRGWRVQRDIEYDLIHEFLIRRARSMLARYADDRGSLAGLLYVAFENFVVSELRGTRRQAALWERHIASETEATNDERSRIEAALALSDLDIEDLLALQALIEGGSVRGAAQRMGVSRWAARKRIFDALDHLDARQPMALFSPKASTER